MELELAAASVLSCLILQSSLCDKLDVCLPAQVFKPIDVAAWHQQLRLVPILVFGA